MAVAVGEVDLDALVNLDDFERAARAVMDAQDFDYFAGGAESETTMRANAAAFADVTLWPRCLVDVSDVDTSASFPELGLPHLAAPLIAAPIAMQKMAHPEGEPAAARACAARRVAYCASQQATTRVENVAEAMTRRETRPDEDPRRRRSTSTADLSPLDASPESKRPRPPLWFQMYAFEDRRRTVDVIRSAERAGAAALAVTVDAPVLGRRERDARNHFAMRAGMRLENVQTAGSTEDATRAEDATRGRSAQETRRDAASRARRARVGGRDASLTWSFLDWIKTVTDLPIVLKGVVRRDDAARAVDAGVAAIWVSNHGGRQLDGAPATLAALPEVVAGVRLATRKKRKGSRRPASTPKIVFDGGVRRGADVLKALALGADLVAFGRPLVWGLACGGEKGVDRVVRALREELRTAAALCGVPRLDRASLADIARVRDDPPPGRRLARSRM